MAWISVRACAVRSRSASVAPSGRANTCFPTPRRIRVTPFFSAVAGFALIVHPSAFLARGRPPATHCTAEGQDGEQARSILGRLLHDLAIGLAGDVVRLARRVPLPGPGISFLLRPASIDALEAPLGRLPRRPDRP